MSINIGPVIDFDQLVSFHHQEVHWQLYPPAGYYPYQFYTGVDVSLSFGMKK
jgi:hypothetical protein